MSDVQVFEGDGVEPEDIVAIPWGGFSVHANRKGMLTYHVFPKAIPKDGPDMSTTVQRSEFLRRTKLDEPVLTALEYGALAVRRHLNIVQLKAEESTGHKAAWFVNWTVEEKMKERAL